MLNIFRSKALALRSPEGIAGLPDSPPPPHQESSLSHQNIGSNAADVGAGTQLMAQHENSRQNFISSTNQTELTFSPCHGTWKTVPETPARNVFDRRFTRNWHFQQYSIS